MCKWTSNNDKNLKCNRKADESGYCLFHKVNKNKEENKLFLKNIIKEKISDLRGFVFEEEFNINEVINYDYEKLYFSESVFYKNVNFSNYKFNKDVCFNYVEFKAYVTFKESTFVENCNFYKTKFNKKYIGEKIFQKVKFKGQNLIINNVENMPRIDGLLLSGCTKFILRDVDYEKEDYIYGKINYRIARNQANKIGDHERIGHYYYKERAYGGKSMKSSDYPTYNEYVCAKLFDKLSKYTIGYGEKPWNLLLISILIISVFAFLYLFVDIRTLDYKFIGLNLNNLKQYSLREIINMYIDLWYFSMVTFSTVGYGDIIVISILGKLLVAIEVFFGVTMGATWASLVIKHLIR